MLPDILLDEAHVSGVIKSTFYEKFSDDIAPASNKVSALFSGEALKKHGLSLPVLLVEALPDGLRPEFLLRRHHLLFG